MLDLLQLHCPPTWVLEKGEVFGHMDRLIMGGLIRHWGVSVETVAEADLAIAHPSCATVQVRLQLLYSWCWWYCCGCCCCCCCWW